MNVGLLSLGPRCFRFVPRVGAVGDDLRNGIAEFLADVRQAWPAAVVFSSVVQQGGDGFIFGPAIVEHDRADAHEMAEIWRAGALADVGAMQLVRVGERIVESSGECHTAGYLILR